MSVKSSLLLILEKIWLLIRVLGLLIVFSLPLLLIERIPGLGTSGGLFLILLTILFFLWCARKNNLTIWDPHLLSWKGMGFVFLAYLLMTACDQLGVYLLSLQGLETTANQLEVEKMLAGMPFLLAFCSTAVLPALAEEVIFRGYLFKKLFGRYSLLGLLGSTILFTLAHGPTNAVSVFIYASSGLILGYSYYKTDYLIYPIAIHLLNNGVATILFYYYVI